MKLDRKSFPKYHRAHLLRQLGFAIAGLLVLCIAIFVVVVSMGPSPTVGDPIESLFAEGPEARPREISSNGYVGSDSCEECHERAHESWSDSHHSKMTQVASAETVMGNFDDVELKIHGLIHRLEKDEAGFWVTMPSSAEKEENAKVGSGIRRKILLCTGSHHMQVYWMSTGRGAELTALPFTWLIEEKQWIPRHASFLQPSFESRGLSDEAIHEIFYEKGRWNTACIHCHTTHGQPKMEEVPRTTVAEFGISCEACHGPGEEHVRTQRDKSLVEEYDPIVSPAELPHARSSEVCGQCHSIHLAASMEQLKEIQNTGKPFRPGECLMGLYDFDSHRIDPGYVWGDGTVRVTGREFTAQLRSPCHTRGESSCFSCHQMHQTKSDSRPEEVWAEDQLKPMMRGNEACLQCHEEYREEKVLTAHTHHLAGSHGSDCMNCHMPNTVYGLLKATRSHEVSNPNTNETLRIGRPNACNLCHLDKSVAWTGQYLSSWYGHDPIPENKKDDTAMSVLMSLRGNAAVRALVAWHMGWEPAREASGEDWMPPYLSILMNDDYNAIRFMAHRSLGKLEGYEDFDFDFMEKESERMKTIEFIKARWKESNQPDDPALLISDGDLDEAADQLLQERDETMVNLLE